jgi:uncharacterized protein (TIGR03067 family)
MFRKCQFAVPALVMIIGFAAANQAKKPPSIAGDWAITELYFEGVKQPKEALESEKIVITESEFAFVEIKYNSVTTWQMKVDDTKTPKEIDFFSRGRLTTRAIYKLDQGRLVVSLRNKGDQKRPDTFTPSAKDGNIIYTLTKNK